MLSSSISPTCPYNMVNFGPLAAEIISLVWGTPANFNRFRVLAALLHGTLLVSANQIAALNRGRHLYSAGRPSRWALAHISSLYVCCLHLSKALYQRLTFLLQVSKYGGPAWTFDDSRQQYFYHYYHSSMPDLNMRHDGVRKEILVHLASFFDGYM